jgi:hypothetical protein
MNEVIPPFDLRVDGTMAGELFGGKKRTMESVTIRSAKIHPRPRQAAKE